MTVQICLIPRLFISSTRVYLRNSSTSTGQDGSLITDHRKLKISLIFSRVKNDHSAMKLGNKSIILIYTGYNKENTKW